MTDAPTARDARVDVLRVGSLTPPGVVSTRTVAVVDSGMARRQTDIVADVIVPGHGAPLRLDGDAYHPPHG